MVTAFGGHPSVGWASDVHPPADTPRSDDRGGTRRFRSPQGLAVLALVLAVVLIALLVARTPVSDTFVTQAGTGAGNGAGSAAKGQGKSASSAIPGATATADLATRCPWLESAMDRHESPDALARLVVGRMTPDEKLGEIVLVETGEYENIDSGVPRLCLPALTLQDGPQGVAFGAVDVTQLPDPLGIAASFDPSLARSYGQVQGTEATGQGIDVVQGPDLNIARVPESGRNFEGFGEDPLLVSDMGVADIEGIQSAGALAMAKHFAVYSQETDRAVIDDVVSERALQEIYLPPFKAAVTRAHVSAVMCAYPQLNGTYQCQDPQLRSLLASWGFAGVVRSDLGSVHDPIAALEAGTDMIKPSSVRALSGLVREGQLPVSAVDAATRAVVAELFADGLVGQPPSGSPDADVATDAHADFALRAAERSAVLLKDARGVLPLHASPTRSVAVIGAAATVPVATGYGSSRVIAPFVSTPLDAILQRMGSGAQVSYVDGGSTTRNLPAVPSALLTPTTGPGHGLTLTLTRTDTAPDHEGTGIVTDSSVTGGGTPAPAQTVHIQVPTADVLLTPHPATSRRLTGDVLPVPIEHSGPSISIDAGDRDDGAGTSATRTRVILPAGWTDASAELTGTLTPDRTGLYTVALQGPGSARLSLDGSTAVSDPLPHGLGRWSQAVSLRAGHPYRFDLTWEPIDKTTPTGEEKVVPGTFTLGWQYDGDQIAAAARSAAGARTAVVFAGDYDSESFDQPTLSLPGDENALIDAVAAANPRTVVVLDTGGPVLMPWLHRVAGVIEDWFPGEQDGAAITAILFGDVDPSGRLPITFPASQAGSSIDSPSQWPGVGLTATYSEGLEVGYRYDHATGTTPLFPFGYGLAYTRFSLRHLSVQRTARGITVTVTVSNTGRRAGSAVPEVYVTQPPAAGEPPAQLAGFTTVALGPGRTRTVHIAVANSAFTAFLGGSWTTVPGAYRVSVGQSSSNLPLSATVTLP